MDFFFFQAEDGIRYRNVTGVQTCALPISGVGDRGAASRDPEGSREAAPRLAPCASGPRLPGGWPRSRAARAQPFEHRSLAEDLERRRPLRTRRSPRGPARETRVAPAAPLPRSDGRERATPR